MREDWSWRCEHVVSTQLRPHIWSRSLRGIGKVERISVTLDALLVFGMQILSALCGQVNRVE